MKIHDNPYISKSILPKPARVSKSDTGKPAFGDALRDAMKTGSQEKTGAPAVSGPAHISRMQFDATLAAQPKLTLATRVENFLDLMDTYQQRLADPASDMKTMAPLVDRMGSERQALATELDKLEDSHPLKPILNQALVMAAKEMVQFRSGAYVDH